MHIVFRDYGKIDTALKRRLSLSKDAKYIQLLWNGTGNETFDERVKALRDCGYTGKEILEGLIILNGNRSRTKTVAAIKLWEDIKAFYHYRCAYCNKVSEHLTKDHILPISKGGADTIGNIVPACADCNRRKNAKRLVTWRGFKKLQLHLFNGS